MKITITFLALVALSYSAPQPRKLFHEHFEDFTRLIMETAAADIDHVLEHYLEFEEFQATIEYLMTPNFRNLIYEMEAIPEFRAAVEFMESHDVDIEFFINAVNEAVDSIPNSRKGLRHEVSGRDMVSFIRDIIAEFPKDELIALHQQKLAEDEEFKRAMESFETEEWMGLYEALWANELFLSEVATLRENGVDVDVLLEEAKAILGIF